MLRALWRIIKWSIALLVLLVVVLLAPVAYIETVCRADPEDRNYDPLITEAEFQRAEANSYLTYPEWHIVYAYEGLANVLRSGDEYEFDYLKSIGGFWSSACALNKMANLRGGGDEATRITVHVIGVSFTVEMAMKALYEETLGRLATIIRGPFKTPQDVYAAEMADDYASFLQQVPWYKYDFNAATDALWAQPVTDPLRSWERRFALAGEWKAKAAYAQAIADAVDATGQAQLRIRSVIRGLSPDQLAAIDGVSVVTSTPDFALIETPRYRQFTRILESIALAGGNVVEIAGNNAIMMTVIAPEENADLPFDKGTVISDIARDGYSSRRLLIGLELADLSDMLRSLESSTYELEHVYDY